MAFDRLLLALAAFMVLVLTLFAVARTLVGL
jgi:hypothetical protein